MDAIITQQTSPDEAFQKFEIIASQLTERLRKLTKQVQDGRQTNDEESVKDAVKNYDEVIEKYNWN